MHLIISENYAELSQKAALLFLNQLAIKPDSVFGLATGSTPLGMYAEIIKARKEYGYDFSRVRTFNLDEYVGLPPTHPQSYHRFMEKNLCNGLNVKKSNINIPEGTAKNLSKFCHEYEQKIKQHPIDLQILGIGANGHIGFNEPGSKATSLTRVVNLTAETIHDNARFFKTENKVPTQAVTMGISTILSAKKIIILASGKHKAEALRRMLEGGRTVDCPASFLQEHPEVYVVLDKAAASLLQKTSQTKNGWSDIRILNKAVLPRGKKILVISPHHDDSAVSCGATIKAFSRQNHITTLVMTAGYRAAMPEELSKSQRIRVRNFEAASEGKILGARTLFGNFNFYDRGKTLWQEDLKKFSKIWQKIKPGIVLLPHTHDEHPTHIASTELVLDYFKQNKQKGIEMWFYEGLWSQHLLASINVVFGFDKNLLAIKNRALQKHRSQTVRLPLVGASESLSRFRALTLPEQRFVSFGQMPPHIAEYIEAYYRVKI
jgi:glucosamine-6-phosphate deaminase